MAFKSVRLLNEAITKEMDAVRKTLMAMPGDVEARDAECSTAIEHLNEMRKLFNELAAKADSPSIEDVTKLSPGDYVATMKPLVGMYHRQLMMVDKLAPCLCEDLSATGVVLMLIGEGKTVVKTAVDPKFEEVQLAVEIILQSLDAGMKKVAEEGVAAAEEQLGITSNGDDVRMGGSPDEADAALADLKDEPS